MGRMTRSIVKVRGSLFLAVLEASGAENPRPLLETPNAAPRKHDSFSGGLFFEIAFLAPGAKFASLLLSWVSGL